MQENNRNRIVFKIHHIQKLELLSQTTAYEMTKLGCQLSSF